MGEAVDGFGKVSVYRVINGADARILSSMSIVCYDTNQLLHILAEMKNPMIKV